MSNTVSSVLFASALSCSIVANAAPLIQPSQTYQPFQQERELELSAEKIVSAFGHQGFRINKAEAAGIRANVRLAVNEARAHGIGNSKVDFAAIEIANDLSVGTDNATVRRIVAAIGELAKISPQPFRPKTPIGPRPAPNPRAPVLPDYNNFWETYFDGVVNLWNQPNFMDLMRGNQFFPVKISWEDIGRHHGSVWGDRISDVGIWVRKYENDPSSARLALSVRRDSNFRDKVLMVSAEKIKVHIRQGKRTIEKTLPQRLAELGLSSPNRDKNVIVSNQFAIVPVPSHNMGVVSARNAPPRVAFNFSIYPYGSTNYVITDVIEGSSEAIVGPGTHQMLYANINGQKAPFTASRAEDRQDLLKLEKELKSQGMDVDVQRYYLIQIPLRRDARNIVPSNMGTPPRDMPLPPSAPIKFKKPFDPGKSYIDAMPTTVAQVEVMPSKMLPPMVETVDERAKNEEGLSRVAIGHGETEGQYNAGSGYRGARADEPIRVTVVYFVTPKGIITEADMQNFASTFSQWDSQAIWGGSFVTKE